MDTGIKMLFIYASVFSDHFMPVHGKEAPVGALSHGNYLDGFSQFNDMDLSTELLEKQHTTLLKRVMGEKLLSIYTRSFALINQPATAIARKLSESANPRDRSFPFPSILPLPPPRLA